MKNQIARFASGESTLTISLHRGVGGIKTSVRYRTPTEKTKVGCKNWFEPNQEEEAAASFTKLVKDATASGWSRVTSRKKLEPTFTEIPPAPLLAELQAAADAVGVPGRRSKR